jgi:spore germination protein GerM
MAEPRRVNVYLWVWEGSPLSDDPLELFPVSRLVNRAAPARPALEALLAGPTAEEQAHGILRLDTVGLSIGTLSIQNGIARVDFTSGPAHSWSGDLSPARFRLAVERTLLQFHAVQSVRVSVDGDEEFASGQG